MKETIEKFEKEKFYIEYEEGNEPYQSIREQIDQEKDKIMENIAEKKKINKEDIDPTEIKVKQPIEGVIHAFKYILKSNACRNRG